MHKLNQVKRERKAKINHGHALEKKGNLRSTEFQNQNV